MPASRARQHYKRHENGLGLGSLVACALLAVMPNAAWGVGQPEQVVEPDAIHDPVRIGTLIDRLGDSSYTVRQIASLTLDGFGPLTIGAIERLMRSSGITPEQRYRLAGIGWSRFRTAPRAGMGISFGAGVQRGVRIERTIRGFHAAEVLAPGDIVLLADGRDVNERLDLQSAILSHSPDETMELRVLRGSREMDVVVRLGSYGDLNNGAIRLPETILRAAWAFRRRVIMDPFSIRRPIDCRTEARTISREISLGPPTPRQLAQLSESAVLERWTGDGSGLVAGGEPRGGVDSMGRVRVRLAGRDASLPTTDRAGQPVGVRSDPRTQLRAIIDDLSVQNSLIVSDLVETRRRLADRSLDANERIRLTKRHLRLTEAASAIDAELRRLAGVEADPGLDGP